MVKARQRLELCLFEGITTNDRVRCHNETRFALPQKFAAWGLRSCVEEQAFSEFTDTGFNLNWLSVGVTKQLSKKPGKVAYRWQAQKFGGDWDYRHILVTGLSWLP